MQPRRRSATATTTALIGALALGASAVGGAGPAASAPVARTGPSSSQSPYLVPAAPGVTTTSLLTVGDAVRGYRLAGIPDGMGAFDNGDGTFTVLVNHEIPAGRGTVRRHGGDGAFVSRWTIRSRTLELLRGEDLVRTVYGPGPGGWTPLVGEARNLSRLCSATLAEPPAFHDRINGIGTGARILTNGEESGTEGRAFAHVVTGPEAGRSFQLPALGRYSYENVVPQPRAGRRTVVVGLDDTSGGQVYVYVGRKIHTGNAVERAGLTGGQLYGLRIEGIAVETDATAVTSAGARFSLVSLGDVSGLTGAQLEQLSLDRGVSRLARPEDGAWDPGDESTFVFNTTGSFTGISRTWRLDFDDPSEVLAGGTARVLVQSPPHDPALPSEDQAGPRMQDNLTVDASGGVISQEDPGNQAYLAGVWRHDLTTGATRRIARHDPDRFSPGGARFLTQDEESSGVIPVPFLGAGSYLLNVQAHHDLDDPELVEDGQLLLMRIGRATR